MMAALPAWVQDVAVDLGVVAAIVTSVGVILKTRAGKAIGGFLRRTYTRAFGKPFTTWLVSSIRDAVRPEIQALSDRNDGQHAENGERLGRIEHDQAVMRRELEVVSTIVAGHGERLDKGSEAMTHIRTALHELVVDVAALRNRPTPSLPPKEDPAA